MEEKQRTNKRKQRVNKRRRLEGLLGQEINVVLLLNGSNGNKSDEINIRGIIEKRDASGSNQGYYLTGTGIQIPMRYLKINPRLYFNHDEDIIVARVKYRNKFIKESSKINSLLQIR